jgi:tRNA A37 threonylcarbamoyltransferase TsaD
LALKAVATKPQRRLLRLIKPFTPMKLRHKSKPMPNMAAFVPEVAARAHLEMIDQVIRDALATAGLTMGDIDAVAGNRWARA